MSQAQLAAAANMNQGYISQIERDSVITRKRTLDALSVALDTPPGVLIGGGRDHDAPQPLDTRELPLLGTIPAGLKPRQARKLDGRR